MAIFIRMWTRCGRCIILGQVAMKLHRLYFGYSSSYKGDSARFSLNPRSWEKGTQRSGVGLPDIHKFSVG